MGYLGAYHLRVCCDDPEHADGPHEVVFSNTQSRKMALHFARKAGWSFNASGKPTVQTEMSGAKKSKGKARCPTCVARKRKGDR